MAGCGGCNDNNTVGKLPDARPPIDTMLTEEPPRPVTVTVTLGGLPKMGQTVYFQQPESTLVLETTTDANGKAQAVVRSGGFVTVIEPEPVLALQAFEVPVITTHLATFAGVKEGDDLHLDIQPAPPTPTAITFDLTVPNEQVDHSYTLYSSCSGSQFLGRGGGLFQAGLGSGAALTASVTLSGCNGTADLLVVSTDAQGQIVGWLYKPATAVADGVALELTGSYELATDVGFNYTSVPTATGGLTVSRALTSSRGSLFSSDPASAEIDTGTATAAATLTLPDPPGVMAVTTTVEQPSSGNGQHTVIEWGAPDAYALDVGAAALHRYDAVPTYDDAGRAVRWTVAAGGGAPDFVIAEYQASRDDGGHVQHWIWRIAAPYGAAPAVTYPTVPTTTFDFNATSADNPFVDRLTTLHLPGGYDAARSRAFADLGSGAITGTTGRIVIEDLFTQLGVQLAPRTWSPRATRRAGSGAR